MSKLAVRILAVILIFVSFASAQTEPKKYAVITQPGGVVVRAAIESGTNMVMMAREGQRFEIVSQGTLWLRIKTPNGEGYVPVAATRIQEGLNSNPAGAIILLLVLGGAVGAGAYLYYAKRKTLTQEEDIFA